MQFRFGTENGGYAGYRLDALGDADGDGRGDLLFQVGGELPAEALVLLDRGDRFAARSSGLLRCDCAIDDRLRIVGRGDAGEPRELARWDGARRRFAGDGAVWVIGAQAALRDGYATGARVLATVPGGTALRRRAPPPDAPPPDGWLPVALDGLPGWISARVVEAQSPDSPDG